MQEQSKSLFGIKGDNFDIRLEYNENYIIVHLPTVEKMTRQVYDEMKVLLEDWSKFFKTVGYEGLHAVTEPNSKAQKLAMMLGFKFLGPYEDMSILIYKE